MSPDSRATNLAHATDLDSLLRELEVQPDYGLSLAVAQERLSRFGSNLRVRPRQVTFWQVALEEITEPMILLLLAVGLIYALWGEPRDALAILAIILTLTILGIEFAIEFRAKQAVAALSTLGPLQNEAGELFGTLCAIDPEPKPESIKAQLPILELTSALLNKLLQSELRLAKWIKQNVRWFYGWVWVKPVSGTGHRGGAVDIYSKTFTKGAVSNARHRQLLPLLLVIEQTAQELVKYLTKRYTRTLAGSPFSGCNTPNILVN